MQGYVVPAIIGTMTSSDFSHRIASDFPVWVIRLLLMFNLCSIPRLGFILRRCEISPVPTDTVVTFRYPYAEEG
jgi:hypothetical protein